jgi:hypothetical protein
VLWACDDQRPFNRPLFSSSAQSACSREKAKRPPVKRKRSFSSSKTKAGSPHPTFRNTIGGVVVLRRDVVGVRVGEGLCHRSEAK